MEGLINPIKVWRDYNNWIVSKIEKNKHEASMLASDSVTELEYKYSQAQKKFPKDEAFLILKSIDLLAGGACEIDWQLARIACFGLLGIPTIPSEISAPDVLGIAMFLSLDFDSVWDQNMHTNMIVPGQVDESDNSESTKGLQRPVKDYLYASCMYHGHVILPSCMWRIYPDDYSEITKNISNWYVREITEKNSNIDKVIINFSKGL